MGEGNETMKLSLKMTTALEMARKGELISSYGNQFFIAGMTNEDGVCERNTLEALVKRGLLAKEPDWSGRGRYRITKEGMEHGKSD